MDSAGNMQGKLSNADVSDALSIYLKFLKSNPPLSEIFFYLQSTFLLDYGFDAIALYAIDNKSALTCVESSGPDILKEQGMSSLSDIKNIIPPMLPTQSEPMTKCILSHDELLIFFPFSRHTAVDTFFLHHTPDGLKSETKSPPSLHFLSLIQSLTSLRWMLCLASLV